MKIKWIGPRKDIGPRTARTGREYDVPDEDAERFIEQGWAKPVGTSTVEAPKVDAPEAEEE